MRNKFILFAVIFMYLCTSALSQAHSNDNVMTDGFIFGTYWFHKYLPLENIPDYDVLREMLNETIDNDELSSVNNETENELDRYIPILYNMIFKRLDDEIILRDEKMDALKTKYPDMEKIQVLDKKYLLFKTDIEKQNFPDNDFCFDQIDEYYSRLIIGLGFHGNSSGNSNGTDVTEGGGYVVKEGDYLRKIARKVYGNKHEFDWVRIYNANKNNKEFLPKPANPDLIYSGVRIVIPQLRIQEE